MMRTLGKYLAIPALLALFALSSASQAMVVSSGFATGAGVFDAGEITLAAGDYTLGLEAFTVDTAGPFIFGISNLSEAFQVSVGTFGSASVMFSTVGGVFDYLVGGSAASGAIYAASISSVPLPPAITILGSALVAMGSIMRLRRGGSPGTA